MQELPREEADPAIALLCPVRALHVYLDRTQSFRTSDQLFVCFGGQQKEKAVSKQRLAHWIMEAIVLAYQARRLPCPLGVRAHSTRGVATSWALARGASIADICRAASWVTPNTFARFYNLRVEPVSSCVLVSDGQKQWNLLGVNHACGAIPLYGPDTCAFVASQFSSPRRTLLKFLPHPRQSGEPVSFPGRDLLPSLLCSYLTPGWLSLPQRLPYVVLPWPVHMCNLHMVPPYAGCGFRSVPLLGVRFPSVFHTHCTEQQWRSSLPKPCPIFRPNWCGGTCRLPQGTGGGQQ